MVPSAWLAWSARDWPHLGDGDRIASLPGAPAQTKYPPLYPLALASGLRLGLPLVALAWKVIAELGVDARIAVFLALNPFFALSGVSLLSEATFTCLLLAALIAAMRDRPVAAGAWAGLACLARSTGVVLLAAVPAAFLLRGQRRGAGLPGGRLDRLGAPEPKRCSANLLHGLPSVLLE